MVISYDILQSRSQSFVPLDQRSENESSGSNHFEITKANNRILVIRLTAQSQTAYMACYGAFLKWMLPELSFSDRWSRGTKLWIRDWIYSKSGHGVINFSNLPIKKSHKILRILIILFCKRKKRTTIIVDHVV